MTLIYLSISVSAVGTFDAKAYGIGFIHGASNTSFSWKPVVNNSKIMIGDYPGSMYDCFIAFKTNQIIQDGYIIVVTVTFDNTTSDYINFVGVGQADSNTIPGNTVMYDSLLNLSYNQKLIAVTKQDDSNQCRVTVTYEAQGYINQYPILFYEVRKVNSTEAIYATSLDLYESIEDAAGSGVTPEEMREVLSSWGEEELLPGIEDSVQAGVTSGMEEALENEKQEASSDGAGNAEELQGAIDEALGHIEEVQKPFETLGSALSYSGQSATLTFPGMNVPFLGQISQPVSVNLTQKISEIMPAELLNIIRGVLSLALVVFPPLEVIRLFNKLLNKG